MQDGADGNGDVAGLQDVVKELDAELKGGSKALKQAQKEVEEWRDVQAGATDELASLQKQIDQLQAVLELNKENLLAKTFRERFWWYMGAIVFFYMV